MPKKLPEKLRVGFETLKYIENIEPLGDWVFSKRLKYWTILVRVTLTRSSKEIAQDTDWYLSVSKDYPNGSLNFFPAKEGGIQCTFPHQEYNGELLPKIPFLSGSPCLTYPDSTLGKLSSSRAPTGAYERLFWYTERLIEWLYSAIDGDLVQDGDPFEFPALPANTSKTTLAYNESAEDFSNWVDAPQYGTLKLSWGTQPNQLYIRHFKDEARFLKPVEWGNSVRMINNDIKGVWFRLDTPLTLEPWQHPRTWQELFEILYYSRIDFLRVFEEFVKPLRGQKTVPVTIGYPVPEVIGGLPKGMHWQGLFVSGLSTGKDFQNNRWNNQEHQCWERDKAVVFEPSKEIRWFNSENLNQSEIGSRGHYPEKLRECKILLVGAGALGSAIAELLIRAGLESLIVLDNQALEQKNLVRHTLTAEDVDASKAVSLANRLNSIYIHAKVKGFHEKFPPREARITQHLEDADVIIDCTASDIVPYQLENYVWKTPKVLIVASLGWRAKTLHIYAKKGKRFNAKNYFQKINPLICEELRNKGDDEAPREGIGCWHPVFPARQDDIYLMASIASKYLEEIYAHTSLDILTAFRQEFNQDSFVGISRESY